MHIKDPCAVQHELQYPICINSRRRHNAISFPTRRDGDPKVRVVALPPRIYAYRLLQSAFHYTLAQAQNWPQRPLANNSQPLHGERSGSYGKIRHQLSYIYATLPGRSTDFYYKGRPRRVRTGFSRYRFTVHRLKIISAREFSAFCIAWCLDSREFVPLHCCHAGCGARLSALSLESPVVSDSSQAQDISWTQLICRSEKCSERCSAKE